MQRKKLNVLKKVLLDAENDALRIRLAQINKEAGFPDNTIGL